MGNDGAHFLCGGEISVPEKTTNVVQMCSSGVQECSRIQNVQGSSCRVQEYKSVQGSSCRVQECSRKFK
jgi:hypothetical protein